MTSPFQAYNRALCRDIRSAKLRDALSRHGYDGSEVDGHVNRQLPGLESRDTAISIQNAIEKQYCDTIRVDTAIELFMAFLETEASNNSCTRAIGAPDAVFPAKKA
jgi:hypothetical protein